MASAAFRSHEMRKIYDDFISLLPKGAGCILCTKPTLKEFKHWKLIRNEFPYDAVAKQHDMLLPIRHIIEDELNKDEIAELKFIKDDFLNSTYDCIIEATPRKKSIPGHFHLHLIVEKE